MKKKNVLEKLVLSVMTFLVAGCMGNEPMQNERQNEKDKTPRTITFVDESSNHISKDKDKAQTRTSLIHEVGKGALVRWVSGDVIYIRDSDGRLQCSKPVSFENGKCKFQFSDYISIPSPTCEVYYGQGESKNKIAVNIEGRQDYGSPGKSDRLGLEGDCGIATAVRNPDGEYGFTLDHKTSFLCLLPRTSNAFVKRSKIVKIEILSTDNIAGVFTLTSDGQLMPKFGMKKKIRIDFPEHDGFTVDNEESDVSKAIYTPILPGKHTMCIRYFLTNNTEDTFNNPAFYGSITKYVTLNCEAGKIHDITANLEIKDYSGNYVGVEASPLHNVCPNINEAMWYSAKGDLKNDVSYPLYSCNGKLYSGCIWVKKKARILADNGITASYMENGFPDPHNGTYTDFRNPGVFNRRIHDKFEGPYAVEADEYFWSTSDFADYFMLPAFPSQLRNGSQSSPLFGGWLSTPDTGEKGMYRRLKRFYFYTANGIRITSFDYINKPIDKLAANPFE